MDTCPNQPLAALVLRAVISPEFFNALLVTDLLQITQRYFTVLGCVLYLRTGGRLSSNAKVQELEADEPLKEHIKMASQEESVREFVAVTDVDEERARFFLESAGWNLQLALASFFEDGADDDIVTLPQPEGGSSVSRSAGPGTQPRVTSFRDLMHEAEEESDEEEGQRFFAGGSERSGQQIVGPPKKKSSNEVVEDLFKGAREHGAVPLERSGKGLGESSKVRAFGGGGYRLGAAPEEESTYVAGERQGSKSHQDVHVVLKLWKTGFSLDNGELRNYTDPGNANFLEAIRRGEIPLELRQRSRGGQVNLDMEDHRDEDFVKLKMAFKAFEGEGQKLGSATPELVSVLTTSEQDQAANEAQARVSVNLDPSQPVTNIQIRLADGGKLVQKFNHTHRVSDLRQFVVAARPAMAAREFVLMTTFPNKELTDESQTLQQANLLNAVIVQRLQ
ncbi:NSFL1 cofactor p47 p97 cofactor p47 [Channa argus]|uniref:NSFL1 cofactor p47 n=2 Tax=Channa argus TaxID=215402 RepID=A0A6G1Q2T6_CHAAH|nr:NSFL1 cofactor p47 p97 cofactor p47 [Channa argus]